MEYETISANEASRLGFRALTTGYKLPRQKQMIQNVLDDMKRGNIPAVLVEASDGVEVWRRNSGMMES